MGVTVKVLRRRTVEVELEEEFLMEIEEGDIEVYYNIDEIEEDNASDYGIDILGDCINNEEYQNWEVVQEVTRVTPKSTSMIESNVLEWY